jgi:hypothetical protein
MGERERENTWDGEARRAYLLVARHHAERRRSVQSPPTAIARPSRAVPVLHGRHSHRRQGTRTWSDLSPCSWLGRSRQGRRVPAREPNGERPTAAGRRLGFEEVRRRSKRKESAWEWAAPSPHQASSWSGRRAARRSAPLEVGLHVSPAATRVWEGGRKGEKRAREWVVARADPVLLSIAKRGTRP